MLKWLNINNKAAKEVHGKTPPSSRADGNTGQSDGVGAGVVGDTESELPVWKRPKSTKLRRAVEPGGDRGMENQNNVDN